ncbi:lipase rog1 [Paramyrothecium foliicola]|nr:lipase rog1 [Paramyrothecium foliicola]
MLLLHQVGSVKIGEVVRYTVTYTPSQDRILPSPEKLYVRVRNTCAVALRAAFVHGPYSLCVAAYPSTFNPNERIEDPSDQGVPEYEPMVKAGGSWECELIVPKAIRLTAGTGLQTAYAKDIDHSAASATWIIEVSSQVLFSNSATVGYELVVAREKKSLNLSSSLPVVGNQTQAPQPGKVIDHQQSIGAKDGHHPAQQKGVFSRAVRIIVEDTASLWNTPRLPGFDDAGDARVRQQKRGGDAPVESMVDTGDPETKEDAPPTKQKKVHMVIVTHGLHSNLGADMLFLKESIDAAAKQAKIDAKARKAKERAEKRQPSGSKSDAPDASEPNVEKTDTAQDDNEDDDDDEEVIVRGYSGNATKTERGIKFLGKRLARYVLSITYPDQPFMPIGKGVDESLLHGTGAHRASVPNLKPAHKHSNIHEVIHKHEPARPYKITSISFIGHSLGGPIQTYAIAYIQKHSPEFFDLIKPINFVALASPFLGLSNENPLYVKFALDFGLVGRTGQDVGLTWRTPTLARSGWGAIVGNFGDSASKKVHGESQVESKPLLRILPTGPAHTALKKFRNRTVYSNVVNDGIVPLRTSCLLFLDWQGLGRVEKARRDAGLVETVVGFGWQELTGANQVAPRKQLLPSVDRSVNISREPSPGDAMFEVPQPAKDAIDEDDRASLQSVPTPFPDPTHTTQPEQSSTGPLSGLFNLFKGNERPKTPPISGRQKKIYHSSQTLSSPDRSTDQVASTSPDSKPGPGKVTTGREFENDADKPVAPPRTSFFESAGDLLNPKLPDVDYFIDPSNRPRTIFHDRVYHPSDIPPPSLKRRSSTLIRRKTLTRIHSFGQHSTDSGSSSPYSSINHQDSMGSARDYDDTANTIPDKHPLDVIDTSDMRVEEKIARAYHRDLSWRKVLVKLEPDAHNNIIVRRRFANAYGWPVVKHLVDAHFSDAANSRRPTEQQHNEERARDINLPPDEHGGETKTGADSQIGTPGTSTPVATVAREEEMEARDKVSDLPRSPESSYDTSSHHTHGPCQIVWTLSRGATGTGRTLMRASQSMVSRARRQGIEATGRRTKLRPDGIGRRRLWARAL